MRLDELGYSLATDERGASCYSTMKRIVRSKYDSTEIALRNAYLATDCIKLAITRKNRRIREESKIEEAPLELTIQDFDVQTVTRKERDAKRALIDEKVKATPQY